MPSEIVEHIRRQCAEFDAEHPSWREEWERDKTLAYERQGRELTAEREREAARKAEKNQLATANNLDGWVAVIDKRIEQHFLSGKLGVGGALKGAIRDALGEIRQQLHDEFKAALEQERRAFEGKLAALEERQAASVSRVDTCIETALLHERDALISAAGGGTTREQLRAEFRHGIGEAIDVVGAQLVEQREKLREDRNSRQVVKSISGGFERD